MASLPQAFLALPITAIEAPASIITVTEATKLRAAIDILLAKGVSSCPVLKKDAPQDSLNRDSFKGVIDIIDIVAFFLEVNNTTKHWDRGFEAILETAVQFADHTVGDIIDTKAATLRHHAVQTDATIDTVLKLLGPQKNHRVLVFDAQNNLVNLISQSKMLTFITQHCLKDPTVAPLFDLTLNSILIESVDPTNPTVIHKCPLVSSGKPILSISSTSKAVDAFKIIHSKRVSGVPVVDAVTGNLIGNISSRDIRSLVGKYENFENLYSTCQEYLFLVKHEREIISAQNSSQMNDCDQDIYCHNMLNRQSKLPAVLTASAEDSLGFVVHCLTANFIRRVYVTSRKLSTDGKVVNIPTGIVTISDLMQIFAGSHSSLFVGLPA